MQLFESLPTSTSTLKFRMSDDSVYIIMNLFALILLIIPGVNAIIFLVVNGYLLGREYFEMAVRRHVSTETAIMLRQKHGPRLMLYGLAVAGYLAIPILNLTAPLFATAMMVHLVADILHKGFLN